MMKPLLRKMKKHLCERSILGLSVAIGVVLLLPLSSNAVTDGSNPYSVILGSDVSMAKKYDGDYLRTLHPTDLLKALSIADITFSIIDDMQVGFNPNKVPLDIKINASGLPHAAGRAIKSLPLMILDGFEISAQRLKNMDMTRIASVSVLDDAQGKAIFGVKGANGVVYIQTARPEGNMTINYAFNGSFEFADISSFDYMNTAQELALEKKAGFYAPGTQEEPLYELRSKINRSGDFWLKSAVQTSFTHKHNLDVEGTEGTVDYKLSIMAAPKAKGVMYGTNKQSYGVGAKLAYNYKKISVSNDLRIDMSSGSETPDVAFEEYGAMSIYSEDRTASGFLNKVLNAGSFNSQLSPVHESNIGNFYNTSYKNFSNNFNVSYEFIKGLVLNGSVTYSKDFDKFERFKSHLSFEYNNWPVEEQPNRGSYAIRRAHQTSIEERIMLSYQHVIGKHSMNYMAAFYASNQKDYYDNYESIGFPNTNMSYISFGKQYAFNTKPGGKEFYNRMISGYGYASYDYDKRYLADITLRWDKSSVMARNERNAVFYSAAIGWNAHNESWMKESNVFSKLVVKAAIGTSGRVEFAYSDANNMYNYLIDNPYLDYQGTNSFALISLNLISKGNPDLKWRTVKTKNLSLETTLFKRVNIAVKYYNMLSDNLVTLASVPSVMGYSSKKVNQGAVRNSGVEFMVNANLFNSESARVNLFVSGYSNKGKLEGFSDYYISVFNNYTKKTSSRFSRMNLLSNGSSPTAIYAVESTGIDPLNGERIYIDKNGKETKTWNSEDLKIVGDLQPALVGNFGLNGSYKNWSANLVFAYSLGGDIYNYFSEYDIENGQVRLNGHVEMSNRWTTPGDKARWKDINDHTWTQSISQYVDKNNILSLSSVNVNYTLPKQVSSKLYMRDLKVGVTCTDLFFSSSATYHRGVNYPMTKSVILSLQATF